MTDNNTLRKFGLVFCLFFFLFFILPSLIKQNPVPHWPLYVTAPVLLLAAAWPKGLAPLFRLWMLIGETLGKINSFIILGIVFFLVFTPIAIFRRLLKDDKLFLKKGDSTESSFKNKRESVVYSEQMKRTF